MNIGKDIATTWIYIIILYIYDIDKLVLLLFKQMHEIYHLYNFNETLKI